MVKRLVGSMGVLAGCLWFACSVWAVTPAADLTIHSFATPTVFSAADNSECEIIGEATSCSAYEVVVTNVGSRPTDGSPVTITDTLPAGLSVAEIQLRWSEAPGNLGLFFCSRTAVQCHFGLAPLAPGASLRMVVYVRVEPGAAATLTNAASVSGGGVAEASTSAQNANGPVPALFGLSAFESSIAGLEGASDTQAGDHPYELATGIYLNNVHRAGPENNSRDTSVHDVKDILVDLPLGFVGSVLATPTCTEGQLSSLACPSDTRVGHIQSFPTGSTSAAGPLYNITAEHGVAAELGFLDAVHGAHLLYVSVVPTPAGYVLRTTSPDIPQITLDRIVVEVYGNPVERDESTNTPVAFFTNPADCSGGPLVTDIHTDSWQSPGSYNTDGGPAFTDPNWAAGTAEAPPVTGCDELRFTGSMTAQPETGVADSPSGVAVELRVPQSETPGVLATPPLRNAVVTLPAGLAVNPSAAGGLATCSMAQVGISPGGEPDAAAPECPEASKVGDVELETPAVAGVLQGSIYLAAQDENPFHTLLAGYIVVDDPTTGVLVKIPGRIEPDPMTGRITATFSESPQFPFSDLKVHFFGGPRAPLTTPTGCGTYTTSAELTPWSAPDSGPPLNTSDSFQINTGCGDGFAPVFSAGTVNNQAGGFSPFTTTFSRQPGEQNLAGVTVTTPPGLLGILKGVERCPEPQASQGTCGANSLIGHTTVAAGSGPDPFWVQGGEVFLTGPYKGAPFGLSVVVPAVAGPFNLGNVVVRAAISVNPNTAQIAVTSDPLPTILDGIPLDVRTVNVAIDRPGFTFNPTNCEPLTVNGSLTSTQGATANLSSRFQAANCQGLPFKPTFAVSTAGRASKQNGASLNVTVTSSAGQANIGKVTVSLPKQLPSRLTTIQQACPEATFAANPASCPAGSVIGAATARTPVLANPVTGPAYLVSHGGAAFPNLVMILQGEGVTLQLIGSIDIKKGVTSSAFDSVPDAPIETFELSLPQGPHSALTTALPAKAKGDLCGSGLIMPTTITGQNGAVITQSTKIAVSGCPKAKAKVKPKRKHAKPRGSKRKKG
jgi:hypothetical protein